MAALGLCTYTEILGGLYYGDLLRDMGAHYIRFIKDFFPSEYITVDTNLRQNGFRGLYEVIRSGLTHEYFIKTTSKVEMDNTQSINSGITYDPNNKPQTVFYVKKYFEDFKNAFDKYFTKLQTESTVLANFVIAHTTAKSGLINDMSKNFVPAVSGGWSGVVLKGKSGP